MDWSAYDRCPVCFRAYDCRMLRRGKRRYVRHAITVEDWSHAIIGYQYVRVEAVPAGWYDRSLKRPHRGRRKREVR